MILLSSSERLICILIILSNRLSFGLVAMVRPYISAEGISGYEIPCYHHAHMPKVDCSRWPVRISSKDNDARPTAFFKQRFMLRTILSQNGQKPPCHGPRAFSIIKSHVTPLLTKNRWTSVDLVTFLTSLADT